MIKQQAIENRWDNMKKCFLLLIAVISVLFTSCTAVIQSNPPQEYYTSAITAPVEVTAMTTLLHPGDTFTVKISAYPYTHGSFMTRNVAEDTSSIFGQHFYTNKDGNAVVTFEILSTQKPGDYELDIGMGSNGSNPFGKTDEQMQIGLFWPISPGDNSYAGNKTAPFTIVSN